MSGSNTIWTFEDVKKATGGKPPVEGDAIVDWEAGSVAIDSRAVEKGDVFIAIKGDKKDGHDFVCDALDRGACIAVVSKIPEGADKTRLLVVDDTLKAMEDMGAYARERASSTVAIAVTGSAGKTGTKELLAAGLAKSGQVHCSSKSYNNQWGVPFTLANMHAGSDFGVFEIGMSNAGEIAPLSRQVRPDIVIITTVFANHAVNFEDGEEGIAREKAKIFDGMPKGGKAVLNRDNKWFSFLKERAEAAGIRVYSFGEHEECDARMIDCLEAANGSRIKADIMGDVVEYSLQIAGRHIANNSLSVLLAVKLAGGDVEKAAKALALQQAVAGRGRREYLDIGEKDNPVTLIDESYNASPEAMKAAFKVMALIDPGRGGRKIAVLGDMYELGGDAEKIHEELALPLQAAGVQLVYTSGPLMKRLYNKLPEEKRGVHEDDVEKLAEIVPDVLVPGDVVMVKGSRGGGDKPRMQVVVEALRSLPAKLGRGGGSRKTA